MARTEKRRIGGLWGYGGGFQLSVSIAALTGQTGFVRGHGFNIAFALAFALT